MRKVLQDDATDVLDFTGCIQIGKFEMRIMTELDPYSKENEEDQTFYVLAYLMKPHPIENGIDRETGIIINTFDNGICYAEIPMKTLEAAKPVMGDFKETKALLGQLKKDAETPEADEPEILAP